MADAFRPKVSTTSSIKAAYGVKVKSSRVTAPKNQQSPGATQTSVLPRIDRRGEPQKPHAPSLLVSPNSAKNGGLSILLPPRRPSSKGAIANTETSPTFHDDEFDGPSAKAAWGTPRNPVPELPMGSRVASFFAAPEERDGSSISVPTPLRLQSVEDSISANEEKYRIDMEQLASNNNKFFEISMSANQHLEHMHNQLPNISEAFDQTDSALQNLSSDIATLHQQHESAMNDMENRLGVAMSNSAEEVVTLSEAHANEKTEILETHERELQKADEAFREKVLELGHRHIEMEKKYLDELQKLRQTSESQIEALQELNRAEKEEHELSAKSALEALQNKAQQELDDLRSSTQTAYTELQKRSQTEFAELQRTSIEELAAAKSCLTAEILSLKQKAADNLAALADRSERELQEHREQSNESLQTLKVFYAQEREYLLEKAAEEVARLQMFEIEQSTRMENRRCREIKALGDELEATKTESSTQIEELHRRYTSELEILKATSEAEKKLLLQTHAVKVENTVAAVAQELSQAISSYEDRLHSMAEAHATEVARNKEEAAQARDALVTKYESDLVSLQNERSREKDALILHYETELETFKQESREEHDKDVKLHETQVLQLREAHSSKVLSLEMAMREQKKKAEDTIQEKDSELEYKQGRINLLEVNEIAQNQQHEQYAERSLEIVEQKNMTLSELESEIWRLDQLNLEKDTMLDSTNRALKAAEEDLQVKANTILELTFVIKSRDDEIEKLRNALLDTVQTVTTKTEILELTTETLSSKAKELEATKNALRLESGKLSMVEESMNQKVGILENTELKMESMQLNMENMRLEMKRMQMDMKLQLEHTEGEIELKNGEIRRLHGTQSELKQKNDFCQQTIERLEESLAFAQRQGEEAQRRIELLRLEATQAAEDMKKVCDELLSKEQDMVIMTREKQKIATEKQRLQIQFNNLAQAAQTLHERVELHTMQAEEIQCQNQRLLQETTAEKDERIRSEKHLHMLELSAAKDMIRHLEGVEERLSDTASKLETVTSERQHLQAEIKTLHETLKKYEDIDQQLHAANENIEQKDKLIESKIQELVELNKCLCNSEDNARHQLDMSRMEIEDATSTAWRLACDKDKVIQQNNSLEEIISNLRMEKEQLMLSLGQEKRGIVSRAEDLQEKIAGLRKEGVQAASEISDLQHALNEKKKELEYLQENLGEQTTDTWKIKSALDTLNSTHTELQAQFDFLSKQRQKEEEEHLDTIQALQENLDNKSRQCEALQQSLSIQCQEIDLLMVQHDSHVMQLTDGHRSEAVQLIESHRAQIAQMTEDHLNQTTKLAEGHLAQVTKLKEKHISEINQLTDQISRLVEEHRSEIALLKETHQAEIDRLTDNLRYQVSELTVDRLSQITEQTEKHRTEVDRFIRDHEREVATLTASHQVQITRMTEDHQTEVACLAEANYNEIARLNANHSIEVARVVEEHCSEISSLKETQQFAVDRLTDDYRYQVSELTVDRLSHITEQTEEHRLILARLEVDHDVEVAQLKEDHQSEVDRLIGTHRNYVCENQQQVLLQQATDEQISEAATFVQRCKNALLLPDDDLFTPDDVVEAIEQLMKILQHFELLQPKLGSPRRQPTATDSPPTLKNKVTAVLAFVEELQLIADFAQNILNDESKNEGDPVSNESSRSSLEALRALTRSPSPATALDELQIDADVAVDDAMQGFDQNLCEFSHEDGDKQQDEFFASPEDKSSSRSPSPFLADSLMDISLVMSDHHRLLSQTARWVAKSRQGGARSHPFSVGTEISRLVREHCALLSLCRRLFKMKDPQQELVSLLEAVALLERVAGRLAFFQARSTRDTDETSHRSLLGRGINFSDSVASLDKCDVGSVELLSRPVLASIGDMARYLQDYDYFLQHVKLDGWTDQKNNSPAAINLEALVQEINDRVMLVDQSKEMLGLENPVEELPPFLIGVQEVLRQAKQLRESSVCFEENKTKTVDELQQGGVIGEVGNGFDALLGEMDAVVEDLRGYNDMLEWMKQVLPNPESVKSVTDLKDRVKRILTEVKTLTVNNTNLMQDSRNLASALEQMKQTRDHLVEEASKEEALLQELAALEAQALLSPVAEVSTRIELVQALIKQQQRACDDAQQRREDMITETAFLQQHDLLSARTDGANEIALSVNMRLEIYSRLLKRADDLQSEKIEMESSLNEEIKQKSEKLVSVEGELAQIRLEMENALAEERAFLSSKEAFSSILNVGRIPEGVLSRIEIYQQLDDEMTQLLDEKHAVETGAAQEYEFLRTNELLPQIGDVGIGATGPTTSMMSPIRLEICQSLVDSLSQLRQHENDLIEEHRFLQKNNLAFDLNQPQKSRLAVYETLLAGQNALIEEKMEREVSFESEKAFLFSHGVPAFENPMEIYGHYVQARNQLADLTTELEEELQFLTENQLCSSNELDGAASLTTPFSSSFRLLVYRKFMQAEVQARETTHKLKENMEQELARQIADDECIIASLTAKVERLEASLMRWQEFAYASQREWDRMLLEEEDKRRSLIRQHEEAQKQVADEHAHALEEITKARDSAVALASGTHVEALELATQEHERRLAAELYKQAQQFELAAFVHSENEARKLTSDTSVSHTSTSISAAQSRAHLLEKLAKRDTTAISMIYKAIRLTTDILSAAPTTSSTTISTSTPRSSEVSTDVTQTVLACVKELKTLKDFLVQSLEQVAKDDDQVPPSFAKAPYAKWMADAVTRATADTDFAIDLALCSHREFMSFAEVQLLTRQEEVEKALTRVYGKLKTAAINGAFTPDQEKQLALELEVTREREARENVACKFRLNEEYYRRLLDERKEMEIAQTANVERLREECTTLKLKLEKLEQQIQQQSALPQFRPPSSSMYTLSPRASVASSQVPRVLKTAAVSNIPMPMRPERPRGGSSAHKDHYISDLERETGQRRTNTAARRFNDMKNREDTITENPGTQLEQDFRAMQAAMTSHHTPAMEPVIPTAMAAPATAPGSSLQNQELWYQGVRLIHYVSFFISIFHVPKQQLFRVEVFNSDTEQQQQTVYVTWTEMQAFLQESRKAARLGIALPADPEMAVTVPQHVRSEIMDILFERVRVYGEGTENILLGFE